MKYKCVALDIDGTLLSDQYEILPLTKQTIQQYHAAGGRVVLCTGRGPENSIPILRQLGLEGVLITNNGATTVTSEDSALIHQFPFSSDEIRPYINYCRERKIHFDMNTSFETYVEQLTDEVKNMYEKYMLKPELVEDVLDTERVYVKLTASGSKEQMDELEVLWQQFDDSMNVIRSGDHFVDVMHQSATKGNALRKLCEHWGIPSEKVVAMGNYFNDVEMLQYAGLGIAMDNSPDGVKEAADQVTDSNQNEGVHKAFLKYIL